MCNENIAVGLITARGGGSTFYRKNAYPILGRPVLAWAIEIMKQAGFIEYIYVWTEDEELSDIARQSGAIALERPKDMVHHYFGNWSLGQWQRRQHKQIRDHLGHDYKYIVPFNCNCIGFRPESLRAMYERLRVEREDGFRIQAVSRTRVGLCLETHNDYQLYPFWNNTEKPLGTGMPPLYRTVGVNIVHRAKANTGDITTLFHEVLEYEGFDFQSPDDIPFAEYYLQSRVNHFEEIL